MTDQRHLKMGLGGYPRIAEELFVQRVPSQHLEV